MCKTSIKIIAFVLFLGVVCGFDVPNYDGYITDKVGVFSETEKSDLTAKIQTIEKSTSIEIAILIVATVDDDINLAAVDVGNKRGVGKKGQDNGLVVLIAVSDRKWSLQVGYGLEGTLPDLVTKQIGEARFPPNFRQGNYYQGVSEMLDDVSGYLLKDPTILQNYSQDSSTTTNIPSNDNLFEFFVLGIFVLILFGKSITVPSSKGKRKMRKYGRWIYAGVGILVSLFALWVLSNIILAVLVSYGALLIGVLLALYGKPGGGMMMMGGGSSFGSGGSSFGGFGGGSFGGGGSSGSR